MGTEHLVERLEMFLVVGWLDGGRPADGRLPFSLADAARELEVGEGRHAMLSVLAALGVLEDAGTIAVEWPGGTGATATVTLRPPLRRQAQALFGD